MVEQDFAQPTLDRKLSTVASAQFLDRLDGGMVEESVVVDMDTVSLSSNDSASDLSVTDTDQPLQPKRPSLGSSRIVQKSIPAVDKELVLAGHDSESDLGYLKLVTCEYQTPEQIFKFEIESLEEIALEKTDGSKNDWHYDYLCEHLNAFPIIEFEVGSSVKEQLEAFFDSPVPFMHFGEQGKVDLFAGDWLEYNLRELVGAKNDGSILDFIGLEDDLECYLEDLEELYLQPNNITQSVGQIMSWGRKADSMARFWDQSIEELVSVLEF